ncbi:hypothetical protein Tco_1097909 [Tanacetum coccineum]
MDLHGIAMVACLYLGLAVPMFSQGDDLIACINKEMAFLPLFKTTGLLCNKFKEGKDKVMMVLDIRVMLLVSGETIQADRQGLLNSIISKTEDLDAYDSDCDDVLNGKEVLMANHSNYGSDVISEKAQRIKPTLYDGSVISSRHAVIPVIDDEETLILEEVIRSNMLAKQNDPILKENKNFLLNKLSGYKLHTLILTNLLRHPSKLRLLRNFLRRECGFEHTKGVFLNEIIPFLRTLKDILNVFDKDLQNEITEVQTVFNQMEAVVQQFSIDKQCFEIHKNELFLENDRLLHQIMYQDVMICVINSTVVFDDVNLEIKKSESCNKCLDLDAELLNKQNAYNDLSKSYSQLKKHCIYLESTMQLNQEIFQKDTSSINQNALEILEYFENNDLKAQLQAKDTTIYKLKEHIKSMRESNKEEKVKQEMDEIETININLEHSVARLLSENKHLHTEIKHLKKIYKD